MAAAVKDRKAKAVDHNRDSAEEKARRERAAARAVKSEEKRQKAADALRQLVLLNRYPSRATPEEIRSAATAAIAVLAPKAKVPVPPLPLDAEVVGG